MSPRQPRREFDFSGVPERSRREFLKLMGASIALASGCSRELPERIVPYEDMPEQLAATKSLYFATALSLDGYGSGVLVESAMGRPIKVEGNPNHPASLGATDVFSQAAVLTLWDPDRSQTVLRQGVLSTWDAFRAALTARRSRFASQGGAGLHILTGSVTSPTLAAQLHRLLDKYPEARWHQYQPINRDNVYAGTRLAFGETREPRYDFTRARTVLSLDADFLRSMPGHVRYARDFNGARRPGETPSANNRLYAIESSPTLTGAKADHCRRLRASQIDRVARALAQRLGIAVESPTSVPIEAGWLDACAFDLLTRHGESLILVGERQPAHVHALAHLANERLGNVGTTVQYTNPVLAEPIDQLDSLRQLSAAMAAGEVQELLILGVNPLYATPADLEFARHLQRVPFSVHLGLYRDETAMRSLWHIPAAHELEAWSDTRAYDGSATIQQPLIAPLYGGRSPHEVLAVLAGEFEQDGHAIVRALWQGELGGDDFEHTWKTSLHNGVVPDSAFTAEQVTARLPALPPLRDADSSELEIVFSPDPHVHDGVYTNNAWLRELPKPLTELTWDNAVLMSPESGRRRGLANEDVVEIEYRGRRVRAPVWLLPGHPDESLTLQFGYGRTAGGRIAPGAGFNAYALQTSAAPSFDGGARVHPLGTRYPLASAQMHNRMEGRDLARMLPLSAVIQRTAQGAQPSKHERKLLYPPFASPTYAWGMSINLDACVGCKACTIACQAENNIPVVGKDQVQRGREMHWIRVDRYFEGSDAHPRVHFQPVPCMHCERAPCEVVCPVEASVHDSEGLNVQVYNRCVGTRFCSNNCPYKVRRFNFLQYSQDVPSLNAQRNPDVTVRMRGVMEKCSYCLQRIAAAKIASEKEGRRIRDGEVVTACQAACPTEAIVFGDLNDPASRVRIAKTSPLDYVLLEELNTLPRTSYLPAVENPHPDLQET
ncbi:MAG TPA: 4Fe-4S dicluster domain-containing protein [Steroidobacteraceae bacterium]|nr:4Fe-4S dicluster domain-containing protein [Steroidobacteraceae bacterium]